ncbi:juvenile hormone esterase-like [Palaemon carinicauda]|uniref:juvenile hormone esterase-like n=1 Tax=Palaemon carinicauda TaxID=392227 RepID=UPI0035B58C1B
MNGILKLTFVIFLKSVVGETDDHSSLEVKYSQGIIVGVRESYNSRQYYAFRGIPYAKPPVGDLRFKEPVGNVSWSGKRKGDTDPPPCPQIVDSKFVGSEDCLYLNIYTPQTGHKAYPVMVFFHGGDFLRGGASDYSPMPILYNDVVLVVLQYRLGILGFLSAEDDILPGNMGLKDQTMALRWVKDNIEAFGGDSSRVTLFGSGSGGTSVHYQILTPYAKGLFTGAIIQSGSALCPGMLRNHYKFVATVLVRKFLCSVDGVPENITYSENLLRCLKDVSTESIATSYRLFLEWQSLPRINVPRVDGDYIPDHPVVLLKEGRYNKVNIIAGFNHHDGSFITSPLYNNPIQWKGFKENFDIVGSLTMGFDEEETPSYLAGISYFRYMTFKNASDTDGIESLTKLYTDRHFGVCIQDMLDLHVRTSGDAENVYLYQLMHKSRTSSCDNTITSVDDQWICHGDEVPFLFDSQFGLSPTEYKNDYSLGSLIVKMWTNFATYWNPTPTDSLGFLWEPFTLGNKKLLLLKPGPSVTNTSICNETILFWHSLATRMNKFLNPDEVGKAVDLGDDKLTEEFDSMPDSEFKTVFYDKEEWTKDQKSLVNKFLTRNQEIDPTDKFTVFVKESVGEIDSMNEDLIYAAGLWSIEIYPRHELYGRSNAMLSNICRMPSSTSNFYRKDQCNLDEARTCKKSTSLQTDVPEELNVYNLIQAGLLKASIVLKGDDEFGEGGDVTRVVDHENLNELVRDYGEHIVEHLKEQKVRNEDLAHFQKLYQMKQKDSLLEEGKDPVASSGGSQTETVVLKNPEIVVDENNPNKKKINYGKLEDFLKEKKTTEVPDLVSSGGN